MDESLFQRITCGEVRLWLILSAMGLATAGLFACVGVGWWRRRLARWVAVGLIAATAAALAWLGWELVVARTAFHDRLYQPEAQGGLARGFPPAEHYEARERARYGPTDPMFRETVAPAREPAPPKRAWWRLVPPDRLDNVWNLVLLAVVFAAGGLVFGLGCGWAWRRLARRDGEER